MLEVAGPADTDRRKFLTLNCKMRSILWVVTRYDVVNLPMVLERPARSALPMAAAGRSELALNQPRLPLAS